MKVGEGVCLGVFGGIWRVDLANMTKTHGIQVWKDQRYVLKYAKN